MGATRSGEGRASVAVRLFFSNTASRLRTARRIHPYDLPYDLHRLLDALGLCRFARQKLRLRQYRRRRCPKGSAWTIRFGRRQRRRRRLGGRNIRRRKDGAVAADAAMAKNGALARRRQGRQRHGPQRIALDCRLSRAWLGARRRSTSFRRDVDRQFPRAAAGNTVGVIRAAAGLASDEPELPFPSTMSRLTFAEAEVTDGFSEVRSDTRIRA